MKSRVSSISLLALLSILTVFAVTPYMTQDAFAASGISSAVADDPDDGDAVYSVGDTIVITFPAQVNATFANGAMSNTEFRANFTVDTTDIDTADTVSGVWNAGATALTLTINTILGGDPPIPNTDTIFYDSAAGNIHYQGNGTEFANTAVTLTGDFGLFVAATVTTTSSGGGSGCDDCKPPTLGIDDRGTRQVTNGFTYNGNSIDVERFFTPYPLIQVKIGQENKAEFKIYENEGVSNIRHFTFAFGLDKGQVVSNSKAMIELDIDHQGNETVTITDPENTLENVRVETSIVPCDDDPRSLCLKITIYHTFRAPLDFNIVATDVWDSKRNAWQNTYNHGIEVVGKSLNPAKDHDGINRGHIYHLTETSKTTAIDELGNSWSLKYDQWTMDEINDNTPKSPFIKNIRSIGDGFMGTDQFGQKYYLTQISPNTAVDMFGNSWSLKSDTWTMDETKNRISMSGYTKNDLEFGMYKYGQYIIAENRLAEICSGCLDEPYDKLNDIFAYEYPIPISSLDNPEIQKILKIESEMAQSLLQSMR